MRYRDLVKHFGTEANAARALDQYRQTVNKWKKEIPLERQIEIERITKGQLKADLPDFVRAA